MLRGIDEHEEIFDALAHHSPKGARKAVEHHLSRIRRRVDAFGASSANGKADARTAS